MKVRPVSAGFAAVLRLRRSTADLRIATGTDSVVQAATSHMARSEQTNTPSCTSVYQSQNQGLERSGAAGPQEAAELLCKLAQNAATGQTIVDPLSPAQTRKTDGQGSPLDAPRLPPCSPKMCMERRDESSPDDAGHMQQLQPTGGRNRDSGILYKIKRSAAEQEDYSRRDLDVTIHTFLPQALETTFDRVHPTSSADAADTEDNDSDGPPLPSRRRQKRSYARDTDRAARASPQSTPQSRSHSTEVDSTRAPRRCKRLRRRKRTQPDSPDPDTVESSVTSVTSTSSGVTSERWPVECFFQRERVGSQEMVTLELPASSLRALFSQGTAPRSGNKRRVTSVKVAARGSRQRARLSKEEGDLLAELKERREPRLSWREIQRHFPNRTSGSLRVHDRTHLNSNNAAQRTIGSGSGSRYSKVEDDLLIELKEQQNPRLTWKQIRRHFPNRTVGSLQVHYCTQMKQ